MNDIFDQVEGEDVIAEGWHVLDEKYVSRNPPKIQWGPGYEKWDDSQKIKYLKKFSNSMNHAAALLQDERDQLNDLCGKKEQQIKQLVSDLAANNAMIQAEIGKMNEKKQVYNAEIARLNAVIRGK